MEINSSTIQDQALLDLLLERNDCVVSPMGELYILDDQTDYSSVCELLRESEAAFGGEFYGIEPELVIADKDVIIEGLNRLRSVKNDSNEKESENTDAHLRLQKLLEATIDKKASDIHLRLNNDQGITEISGRILGEFVELQGNQQFSYGETIGNYAAVTLGKRQAFSVNSQVDVTFEIELDVKRKKEGKEIISRRPTKWRMSQIAIDEGTKLTFRSLETGSDQLPKMETLGLSRGHVKAFVDYVNSAQGAILMSGPVGSGKTTTINVGLETIKSTRLVHSLEDPVEFKRRGRNHFATPVNEEYLDPKTDLKTKSFQYYGKVLLRHDTNVVYFGEVRDKSAAAQFMRLATTGQVMVGTIHCNSAITIITTLAEQLGVPVTQLAAPGILKALAHQRLVRTLCPHCKISHADAPKFFKYDDSLQSAYKSIQELQENINKDISNVHYRKTWGTCEHCGGKGENDRTALFEIIPIDDKARSFIRELRLSEWEEHLKAQKWPSIQQHAQYKILKGIVDYRSVVEQVDNIIEEDMTELFAMMHEEY